MSVSSHSVQIQQGTLHFSTRPKSTTSLTKQTSKKKTENCNTWWCSFIK